MGPTLGLRYPWAMRTPVPLKHACRLLNHGPTTLIATAHDGRRNVMAAQWVMPLDFHPPLLAAVLSGDTFTRELLDASGRCVVMLPTTAQVDLVYAVGSCSGRDEDKFDKFAIAVEDATMMAVPTIAGCAAWLECVVRLDPAARAAYELIVLECVAAFADEALWAAGDWRFAPDGPRTIHHTTRGSFFATGARLDAKG